MLFFKENMLIMENWETKGERREENERERMYQRKYKEKLIPDTMALTLSPIFCAILFLKLKRKTEH